MKRIYNVVIIDDDQASIDNLVACLNSFQMLEIAGTARNGHLGKKIIAKNKPDLLFLDMELTDMSGIDMFNEIKNEIDWSMRVIIYSAHDKYMLQAFREVAFDYLLKPIDPLELETIISRTLEDINSELIPVAPPYIQLRSLSKDHKAFIIATPTNDFQVLHTEDIGYFKYNQERKQWEVYPCSQPKIALRRNTTAENILKSSPSFVQIHQSCIININYLVTIKEKRCVLYPPFDQVNDLSISNIFHKKLLKMFQQF